MRVRNMDIGETKYVIRGKRKDTGEYVYITSMILHSNPICAKLFNYIEDAEEWFNDNLEVFMARKINKFLDTNTLEIVKITLQLNSISKLEVPKIEEETK